MKDSRDEVHTSTEQVPIHPEYNKNKIQGHNNCNLYQDVHSWHGMIIESPEFDSNYLLIVCVPFLILKFIQRHL